MSRNYRVIFAVGLLLAGMLTAAPMAEHVAKGDWYNVTTDYYRCTFFNGCMYPVWFKSADGTREYPYSFLLDWIKESDAPDIKIHYLRQELHADVKIITNTNDTLVVECTGFFCLTRRRFPNVTARYRYTLHKNSPDILLEGELSLAQGSPKKLMQVLVGSLTWRNMPFEKIRIGDGHDMPFRTPGEASKSFLSDQGIALTLANGLTAGIKGPANAWNNAEDRFFTYLSHKLEPSQRLWDGSTPFIFKVTYAFR